MSIWRSAVLDEAIQVIKSKIKYILGALTGILILALIFMALFWSRLESIVVQKIIAAGLKQNVQLQFDNPKFFLLGLESQKLDIRAFVNRIPLILNIEQFKIASEPWQLFEGRFNQQTVFNLYGGNAVIRSLSRSKAKIHKVDFEINNIDLTQWPSVQFIGLQQGSLHLHGNKFDVNSGKIKSGEFKVQLNDLARENVFVLGPQISNLPFEVRVPPFKRVSLLSEGNISQEFIDISKLNINGDLGSYFLKGRFSREGKIINMEGRVELSPAAQSIFAALLPLLSSGELTEQSQVFSYRFKGYSSGIPLFSFTEYGY